MDPTAPNPTRLISDLGPRRSDTLRTWRERAVVACLIACAAITICITLGIIGILVVETIRFFDPAGHPDGQHEISVVRPSDFFLGLQWNPQLGSDKHFGVWPLVVGTFKIAAVAMAFALPVGLIAAVWLSEYARPRLRAWIKPILEVLAGIPTVVFGFFAITFITPVLLRWEWLRVPVRDGRGNIEYNQNTGEMITEPAGLLGLFDFDTFNAMGAGLAVGIMCLPIVTSLAEDALRAVPRALREGSYAMGASKFETSTKVVMPAALSGISAAFFLAIARAVGETMIVALAAGASSVKMLDQGGVLANLRSALALDESVLPMTGFIVKVYTGDAEHGSIEYYSAYAVAATLFVITLGLTIIGNLIQKRFRETYE